MGTTKIATYELSMLELTNVDKRMECAGLRCSLRLMTLWLQPIQDNLHSQLLTHHAVSSHRSCTLHSNKGVLRQYIFCKIFDLELLEGIICHFVI